MVDIHSAPAISMKPCWRPWAVSTRPIAEMPRVISQKPQLPSLKLQSAGAP